MIPENLDFMLKYGGDGTIGGGSIFGRADTQFWENVWSGDIELARNHAVKNQALLEALWLPGGWAGKYGAYQSQLKKIMELMAVPGGVVRSPRLPILDPKAISEIREILKSFEIIK
jgi:4-hydroxy-tetrahydrodipicolinate synthase